MRTIILFFAPIIFFQNNWQEYINIEGRFKIFTPGQFEEKIDSVSTDIGDLVYYTFFYQNINKENSEHEVFMVSYCDYPAGIVFSDPIGLTEDLFQTTMDAAIESVNGELLYFTDIQLDNYPGKFWRIDYPDGKGTIKTKAFLVKDRYYAVQVISFNKNQLINSANKFFDSFKFL